MANLSFNAANVSPSVVYAPLPAGDYQAIITESETKATKDGQGQYLQLKLQIQGGEFSGRVLFDRLNLWNNNQQAQEIAQRALSASPTGYHSSPRPLAGARVGGRLDSHPFRHHAGQPGPDG